jgi:hypothetical protein
MPSYEAWVERSKVLLKERVKSEGKSEDAKFL